MKLKLTFLILLLAVFVSCKKTTNVDVSLSNSGKLSYKLTDEAGKGLPNVKVSLFDRLESYYADNNILIDERITDASGLVDFGDLNPKSYLIVADSAKVNNVNYIVKEYTQVVTGVAKHKDIKVTDFSGTLKVKVTSYNTGQALKNMGVLIIPYIHFDYNNNVTKYINLAEFKGITDSEGLISFKIPSEKDYWICIYNTSTNVNNGYASFRVQKGASITYPMNVYQ